MFTLVFKRAKAKGRFGRAAGRSLQAVPGARTAKSSTESSPTVKRALPLWLAAVVPTTLAAHGLGYVLTGRNATDGVHAWVLPALECSTAFLVALCSSLLANALLRTGFFVHTAVERSTFALWTRLALSQLAIYVAMERAEGGHAGLLGCAVQIIAALVVAYLLSLFSCVLERFEGSAVIALRYLEHFANCSAIIVSNRGFSTAYALAVRAGTARFQRPPPDPDRLFS